jgi:hypothetical protein
LSIVAVVRHPLDEGGGRRERQEVVLGVSVCVSGICRGDGSDCRVLVMVVKVVMAVGMAAVM